MPIFASYELQLGIADRIERLLIESSLPVLLLASPFFSD
jgi:hypothetical protein